MCIHTRVATKLVYSRTPFIWINREAKPSGYAENPDNWSFFFKWSVLAVWSSAVTIYSMYLRLNLLASQVLSSRCHNVLRYKSEGRWFDPSWCHWKFSLTLIPSDRTMALGSTQPLTE